MTKMNSTEEIICSEKAFKSASDLLELIANNILNSPMFFYSGKNVWCDWARNLSGTQRTIYTIDFAYSHNLISDAAVLLRKFRDDLLQSLYLQLLIKKHSPLFDDNNSLSNDSSILLHWFQSELTKSERDKEIKTSVYKTRLSENNSFVKALFDSDDFLKSEWTEVDRVLNSYMHGNGIKYFIDNISPNRSKEYFVQLFNDVMVIYLSILILENPILLHSSDYGDYFELGMEPPFGSQYWVAPIAVDYLDEYIRKHNEKLYDYLFENQPIAMEWKKNE